MNGKAMNGEAEGSADQSTRLTQFEVASGDAAPPPALKTFGGVFALLWVVLLVFIYWTRLGQRRLMTRVDELEASLPKSGN